MPLKTFKTTLDFSGSPVVKNLHFRCRGWGSTPGLETKIPHAIWHSQKKKKTCILRGQIATLTEIWKKLIPTLTGDFEKFKTSAKKATADGVEIARELDVEMQPEYGTEFLQSR